MKNWYGNLSELGKCYTVAAIDRSDALYKDGFQGKWGNVMRRHYTITNCLRRPFYQEILKLIRPYVENDLKLGDKKGVNESSSLD